MLNGKDLISLGIKPGPDFSVILEKSKSFATKDEAIAFAKTFIKPVENKVKNKFVEEGSVFDFFLNEGRHLLPGFLEGTSSVPSNSEIRRLIENKAVVVNGIAPTLTACMDNQFPIWQLIFFPNGKRRTTVIDEPSFCILPDGTKQPENASPWVDVKGNPL